MKQLVIGVAMMAILAGCEKNDGKVAVEVKDDVVITITPDSRTYAELSTNDVVVRINGAELTKGEVERQIAFRIAMAKLRPMAKLDTRQEARIRGELQRTCAPQFILQELLKGYAEKSGVTVTEQDRIPMREKLVRQYARGGKYSKLVKSLSQENKALLGSGVDRELWVQKGREKLVADNLKPVEDKEVSDRRAYFERYNERANVALAKTWSDASNVWQKAVGGYPFEKLVAQYEDGEVEHISAEAEWGDIKASDFKDDKGLYRVLMTTPEGAIVPPFEGDNGVMVVKMLKILPANDEQTEPLYRLSKIHFELPEIWEVETDAEIRADLEKIHKREAFQRGLKSLVDASKIDYPCGTNLFPRVSRRRPALPAAALNRLPRGVKLPN